MIDMTEKVCPTCGHKEPKTWNELVAEFALTRPESERWIAELMVNYNSYHFTEGKSHMEQQWEKWLSVWEHGYQEGWEERYRW